MVGTEHCIASCDEIEHFLLSQKVPVHEGRLLKYAYDCKELPRSQEQLFVYHFELYHRLYQLKENAGWRGLYLHLDPMRIRLLSMSEGCSFYFAGQAIFCGAQILSAGRCICHPDVNSFGFPVFDPLRDFYSDRENIGFFYSELFQKSLNGFAVYCFRAGAVREALLFFGFTITLPGRALVVKRYRELARIYHPDSSDGDIEKMKKLNAHYDILREVFPF